MPFYFGNEVGLLMYSASFPDPTKRNMISRLLNSPSESENGIPDEVTFKDTLALPQKRGSFPPSRVRDHIYFQVPKQKNKRSSRSPTETDHAACSIALCLVFFLYAPSSVRLKISGTKTITVLNLQSCCSENPVRTHNRFRVVVSFTRFRKRAHI